MKRILQLAFCLLLTTPLLMGQAKKYLMFEHFTQASCGPCATQNPAFQAIYDENTANAYHIAYHTSWPGFDPMYNVNTVENGFMPGFYGVTGVPRMIVDGQDCCSPTGVSQAMIDGAGTSPIRLVVKQNGTDVDIEIQSLGETDVTKSYNLRVAVIEGLIEYANAPGSNGEREFPNVFRQFIANSTDGEAINLAEQGSSITRSYSFTMDPEWQEEEIYIIAYVQDADNSDILNAGSSKGVNFELVNSSEDQIVAGAPATQSSFSGNLFMSADDSVVINVETDTPSGWGHVVTVDGALASDGDEISLSAGDHEINVIAQPGQTSGIGSYKVSVASPTTGLAQTTTYHVVSNVTDLVVAASSPDADLAINYTQGLDLAANDKSGLLPKDLVTASSMAGALAGVEHLYFNVGWTFPALNDDLTQALMDFLDRGGNLMISGQDLGWDLNDTASGAANGTPFQKTFYDTYLQALYQGDGAPTENSFTFLPDDEIYGAQEGSGIEAVYGAANVYPDQFVPRNAAEGSTILRWNNNRSGGIRVENETHKIVYLGIGLEMVADKDVADAIAKITHDYFHATTTGLEFDELFSGLTSSAAPNPVVDVLNISIENLESNQLAINIFDNQGNLIETLDTQIGKETYKVNVTNYAEGLYYYQLSDGTVGSTAGKFMKI